jgi:hypothetical protein
MWIFMDAGSKASRLIKKQGENMSIFFDSWAWVGFLGPNVQHSAVLTVYNIKSNSVSTSN